MPNDMAARTLSAVIAMPRAFEELAGALAHLSAQTRRGDIEVVLVHTPSGAPTIRREAFEGFGRFIAVEVPAMPTVASAFAAACDAATGDVVALVEDHVLLDPGWADAVLAAHAGPCAAVAPRMSNANPATSVSWANFLASFHEAIAYRAAGPVAYGPGHNTSYKRSVLSQYRSELRSLYQSERTFHYRLARDGRQIVFTPDARLGHLNISSGRQALRHAFLGGALFGRYRSRGMGPVERVVRTAGAPTVPLLRFGRILGQVARADVRRDVPGAAWALLGALLAAHAAGEVAGYWGLVPDIEARYEFFELHRLECLRVDERTLMLGAA